MAGLPNLNATIRLLPDPFQVGLDFWVVPQSIQVVVLGCQRLVGKEGVQCLVTGHAQINRLRAAFSAWNNVVARGRFNHALT